MGDQVKTFQLKCLQCLRSCERLLCTAVCRHGLCVRCLKSQLVPPPLTGQAHTARLECPVCPEQVEAPQKPVDQWLTSLHTNTQLHLCLRAKEADCTLWCEPCARRQASLSAGSACATCEELLCDTCNAVHRSSKSSRMHQIFTLGDESSVNQAIVYMGVCENCSKHVTSTSARIKHKVLLCNTCTISNKIGCGVLRGALQDDSCGIDSIPVDDLIKQYRDELLDVKRYCDKLLKRLANDLETFATNVRTMKESIATVRKSFNSKLDEYEKEFLAKAGFIKDIKISEVNDSVKLRSSISTAIDYDLEILDIYLHNATPNQTGMYCLSMLKRPDNYRKAFTAKLPRVTQVTFEHRLPREVFTVAVDTPFLSVSCWPRQISVEKLLEKEVGMGKYDSVLMPVNLSQSKYSNNNVCGKR